jgi:hypothetical protein
MFGHDAVCIARTGRSGRQSGDIDVVLDGEQHAEQRLLVPQRRADLAQPRIAGVGDGEQFSACAFGDPGLRRSACLLADEAQDQRAHRDRAFAQCVSQLRQGAWFRRHRFSPRFCACLLVCKIKAGAVPGATRDALLPFLRAQLERAAA